MENKYFAHPTVEVNPKAQIGEGTKIWNQTQVREYAQIGSNCNIGKNVYIDTKVEIGNRVKIENNVSVYQGVTIEDDAFLGPSCVFTNDLRPRSWIWNPDMVVSTRIKKGASIGANATILCGLTINEYAMVGAGSVVLGEVPAYGLVCGNPAKLKSFICECGHNLEKIIEQEGAKQIEQKEQEQILMRCKQCGKEIGIKIEDYKKLDNDI